MEKIRGKKAKRVDGYYYVKFKGEDKEIIAKYTVSEYWQGWTVTGNESTFEDSEFSGIDETKIERKFDPLNVGGAKGEISKDF